MTLNAKELADGDCHHQTSLLVIILGSHTSGKSTIARLMHDRFQLPYDGELGDTLRVPAGGDNVVTGYQHPDMTPAEAADELGGWDNFVHRKEHERDEARRMDQPITIVETWHVQNYSWVAFRDRVDPRKKGDSEQTERLREYFEKAKAAVDEVMDRGFKVIAVNLCTQQETMLRRKFGGGGENGNGSISQVNVDRTEAIRLHSTLQAMSGRFISRYNSMSTAERQIPLLMIDNDADGQAAMNNVIVRVMEFVNGHARTLLNSL